MSPVPPVDPSATSSANTTNSLNKSILLKSAAERFEISASESTSIFVNCNLKAPRCDENERKPIDMVVVLDRSGSMSGSKLNLCKKTMNFLSQQLSPLDRVSLVSYDSNVRTDMPLTRMDDNGKFKFASIIKDICAGSATNLSGGLFAGIDEIQQDRRQDGGDPNPIQSILMLTDGHANDGVTNVDDLSKMLEGMLSTRASLHTFGYGSNHDATLLSRLADIGRGNYYFVQNVDSVAMAFADCLGGLLSVVAQNIKIEVVASPGVTISAIKTKRNITKITDKAHYEVEMGDLFAEEGRDVMVQVDLAPATNPAEQVPLIEFRMRYANVLLSTLEKIESIATIGRPTTVTNFAVNEEVVIQKQRIAAAEAMEAAAEAAEKGDLQQGRAFIELAMAKARIETSDLSSQVKDQASYLFNAYSECQSNMASDSVYRARGHGRMRQQVQSTWMQRENNIEMDEDTVSVDMNPPAMAAPPPSGSLSRFFGFFKSSAPTRSSAPMPSSARRLSSAPTRSFAPMNSSTPQPLASAAPTDLTSLADSSPPPAQSTAYANRNESQMRMMKKAREIK